MIILQAKMKIMKRQQIIPPSINLIVNYPQCFIDLLKNTQYKSEKAFIGYGNPSAKILIVGQELAWDKETQANEYEHYCLKNIEHWEKNINKGENVTIKSQILYPEDDIHSEAFENFNPLFPHYFNYNKLDSRKPITEINGKFTHQYLKYGANPTWFKYQKLIQFIYNRQSEYIDFFKDAFITELSGESRRHNIVVNRDLPEEEQKRDAQEQAEQTERSISKRCHLLKEPFFQSFPIVIFACGRYSDKIFPYLYGFEKGDFEKKGWFSVLRQNKKIYICTWQFSARISESMLKELAKVICPYI